MNNNNTISVEQFNAIVLANLESNATDVICNELSYIESYDEAMRFVEALKDRNSDAFKHVETALLDRNNYDWSKHELAVLLPPMVAHIIDNCGLDNLDVLVDVVDNLNSKDNFF